MNKSSAKIIGGNVAQIQLTAVLQSDFSQSDLTDREKSVDIGITLLKRDRAKCLDISVLRTKRLCWGNVISSHEGERGGLTVTYMLRPCEVVVTTSFFIFQKRFIHIDDWDIVFISQNTQEDQRAMGAPL